MKTVPGLHIASALMAYSDVSGKWHVMLTGTKTFNDVPYSFQYESSINKIIFSGVEYHRVANGGDMDLVRRLRTSTHDNINAWLYARGITGNDV